MQDTFLQVLVVALGLLMYPNSDHDVVDWDQALVTSGMQDREQKLSTEEQKLNQEIAAGDFQSLQEEKKTAQALFLETHLENSDLPLTTTRGQADTETWSYQDNNSKIVPSMKSTEKQNHSKETPAESILNSDYFWIIWKTFSIVSFIHFLWKCRRNSHLESNGAKTISRANAAEYLSVDSTTLQMFYSQCVQSGYNKKHREEEFLDGFVGDLLESMKNVCGDSMAIGTAAFEDAQVVVPLTPPEPYTFNCSYSNKADDVLLDMQMCGQIELRKNAQIQYCCPCQTSGAADDVVCLLHNERHTIKQSVDFEEQLCKKGSKYLSKAEVGKWFQSKLRQAWSLIAFKYEFEVCINNSNIPGAVIVRFRSGEKMHFTMSPVIRFDSQSYFFITRCSPKTLDTSWSLSLSKYEDTFLHQMAKVLPDNSCHIQILQIALFLHKKQAMFTGSSALKDLHFKTGLMHLLLTKAPSEWRPSLLANRLKDLLDFMMYSLKTKHLIHVLIGNLRATEIVQLPADLVKSNPVNLFHPLVVHRCIHQNALMHFVELLKNAQILINDYLGKPRRPSEQSK
ncbi:inositol 1,4,5-trisphosphate receptor-interacting protein-like [Eucyclogobius newberryi]|uniref:inositol 1,4,5-trisphosphate receptor-interacting protein-like n=1 Tax=Eucyclogobius newberryi TaxID=166745 RepID=UPI003B5C97F9